MEITFLGHSSFKIKGKNLVLVTDPFDPEAVGFKFPKVKAEIVTISHEHQDHNRQDLVGGVKKVISGPGEYEIADTSIIGFSSFHDSVQGKERGKNTLYLIEMDDIRIVHLGDLGHTLGEQKIAQIGEIDLLMLPVGGVYTLGPKEAVEIARSLNPKIILPMHYWMDGLNPEVFSKLLPVENFLSQMGVEVKKLPKLVIKKGEPLSEEQVIVLLEKK